MSWVENRAYEGKRNNFCALNFTNDNGVENVNQFKIQNSLLTPAIFLVP